MGTGGVLRHLSSGDPDANSKPHHSLNRWFSQNESKLLKISVISISALIILHIFVVSIQIFPERFVRGLQAGTLMLISLIFLSVVSKGMIPIIICILGTTLIYSSIVLPYSGIVDNEPFKLDGASIVPSYQAVLVASQMHFFLGIGAVVLSIIVAYRPSALFTRNRPISLEEAWSKYHVWHDNAKLVDGYSEPSILVTQLMDDQDRYSMWRYEYVLVVIYGTPHLVRPSGYVPLNSEIIRDRESGRIVGKARYTGFA